MVIGMLLVILGLVVNQAEGVLVKSYGKKHKNGGMFFNAIICLFAMIYFFITDENGLSFPKEIIIYGLINSFMYAAGFYLMYLALEIGSFGLTRLFTSLGVIIYTFYGILFLGESATIMTYLALVLILISLILMNCKKEGEEGQSISLRWVIYILLTIAANAVIVILGRIQFGMFGDEYNNEFLIISLGGAVIYLMVLSLIFERKSIVSTLKHGLLYGAGAGIFNGIKNLLTLVVYKYLPISFTSPVNSGLGMALSFFVSVLVYKEKFTGRQIVSVVLGVAAVVLMNL